MGLSKALSDRFERTFSLKKKKRLNVLLSHKRTDLYFNLTLSLAFLQHPTMQLYWSSMRLRILIWERVFEEQVVSSLTWSFGIQIWYRVPCLLANFHLVASLQICADPQNSEPCVGSHLCRTSGGRVSEVHPPWWIGKTQTFQTGKPHPWAAGIDF